MQWRLAASDTAPPSSLKRLAEMRALVAFHPPVSAHCFFIYLFFCVVTMSASRRDRSIKAMRELLLHPQFFWTHIRRGATTTRGLSCAARGWCLGLLPRRWPALSCPSLPHLFCVWTIDVGHPCCTCVRITVSGGVAGSCGLPPPGFRSLILHLSFLLVIESMYDLSKPR